MSFFWPGLLVLIVLVPLLVVAYVVAQRRHRPAGVRYSSVSLMHAARPVRSRLRRHLPFACFALAVALLLIAVARPAMTIAVPSNQATIILTIDVSRSMCASDIEPNRLLAAEEAAAAFIEGQGADSLIGIVGFSGFAQIIQAPTTDRRLLHDALASLVTGRRTGIGHAILEAIDAISLIDPSVPRAVRDDRPGTQPEAVPEGSYVPAIIVLLTDGANNTGPEPVDAARQAADRGIRVYTIGFGTEQGGPFSEVCPQQLIGGEPERFGPGGPGGGFGGFGGFGGGGFRRGIDEPTLQRVAEATGGTYYPAGSADELQAVFDALPTSLIVKTESTEISVVFVGLALAAAAAAFVLGRLWRPLP
jgi:Ca-activated chloride channel family protein